MSHIVRQPADIIDLDALSVACRRRGLEFRPNKTHHAWWGRFVGDSPGIAGVDPSLYGTCLHAIGEKGTIPSDGYGGHWEIGLVANPNGRGYSLVFDNYGESGRRITALAGENLSGLIQEYGVEVATRKMQRQGYRVTRAETAGKVRLHCYR